MSALSGPHGWTPVELLIAGFRQPRSPGTSVDAAAFRVAGAFAPTHRSTGRLRVKNGVKDRAAGG